MTLGQQIGVLLFIAAFVLLFMLPSIVAIWGRNRFWWAIVLSNLVVPLTPWLWIALLFTAINGERPRLRRRR